MSPIIEFKDINKTYGSTVILDNFNLEIEKGEFITMIGSSGSGKTTILKIEHGEAKATGHASLAVTAPVFSLADFPETEPVATRKPIDADTYRIGKWLGTAPRSWQGKAGAEYRAGVRETDPIYAREGLVHPGVLQQIMNRVLMENALLGPWIHIGSRMQLISAAIDSDQLTARARITGNYEKKGHLFVELDALIVANGRTPVAHCQHIAIYQPRPQAV